MQWHRTLRDVPSCTAPHSIILARDRDATGRKEYSHMSLDTAIQLIGATPNAAYYEHVQDAPCVAYFDIDLKTNDDPTDVLGSNVRWIRELLDESGYAYNEADLRLLDGSRPGKASFHVLIRSLCLPNDAARAALKKAIRARLARVPSDVDPSPYSRNALLRTPLSSKMGVGVPLRPIGGHPLREYMLNAVPDGAIPIHNTFTAVQQVAERPVAGDHSAAVVRAVRTAGDVKSELRSVEAGAYYFVTKRTRRCLLNKEINHASNNFCVSVDADGGLTYRCFSSRCARHTLHIGFVDAAVATGAEWERCVEKHAYTSERTEPLVLRDGLTLLRAPMGTGKTYRLRELIQALAPATRVLIVSFRVSLCQYMRSYMARGDCAFELYSERAGELRDVARLIVTVNSLGRLVGSTYDLIVLDESESVLEQFSGVHPVHMKLAWLVFEKLVRDTPRVLCLDAAIGPRTYYVMRSMKERVTLTVNEVVPIGMRRTVVVVGKDQFLGAMLDALRGGRVAVASTSASELIALHSALRAEFPEKRLYLIHAGTSEAEKRLFFQRCNEMLEGCDGLLYSPTIQAGNSIDVPFDELFVYATPSGPTPEGVHQMMGRVRNVRTERVMVTFDSTPTEERREYTFAEITEHLTNPLERMHAGTALGKRFGEDWRLEFERSPLFVMVVWNTLYRVNGYQNFAPRFLRLCSEKGYEVRRECRNACDRGAALRDAIRRGVERTNDERMQEIVAAPTLDAAAYARLRQQLRIPTDERKLALAVERYEFCTHYNVRPDELTVPMLRRYARPAKRGAYHRLCLMMPEGGASDGDAVRRRIDAVLLAEGALLADAGDQVYAATNLPRTNGVRLRYAHQLIADLGFDSAFDRKRLAHATVEASAARLVPILAEHAVSINAVFLTPVRRREAPVAEWRPHDAIRYVNQCTRRLLGVYVRRSKSAYQLVGTGAWDGSVPLRSANLQGGDVFG
jgi:hypothetical protein